MKKHFLIFCVFLLPFFVFSQEKFGEQEEPHTYFFAVRIITTATGVGEYFIVYAPNGTIEKVDLITMAEFERQALGQNQSNANLKGENMFEKNGIKQYKIHTWLWKLRFAEYPYFKDEDNIGWTQNFENTYMPRPEQMEILSGYGINKINDFIWGNNLFRLLKDMENSQWVNAYMQAGKN